MPYLTMSHIHPTEGEKMPTKCRRREETKGTGTGWGEQPRECSKKHRRKKEQGSGDEIHAVGQTHPLPGCEQTEHAPGVSE